MSSDLFSTGVRPVIDAHLLKLSEEKRDYGKYWSASSAGYCMRKNIFERLGLPHVESDDAARKQRVFTSGHIFHNWIQELTKDAGISIAQEIELQDEDLMVRGHFDDLVLIPEPSTHIKPNIQPGAKDGSTETKNHPNKINIITLPSKLILYDYKTRNSKNFHYAKVPSYFHKLQLGTYMYMLRQKNWLAKRATKFDLEPKHAPADTKDLTEARTLNIEKDTLRMAEVQYLWSDELEKEVVEYWTALNKYWANRQIPPCTCHEQAEGFMAKEKWNPYFYEGKPCSIEYFAKFPEFKKKWETA